MTDGRFQKGHVPLNPIKRGERRSPATEFQVGQRPSTVLPVGAVTIREERNSPARRWIKVAEPDKWMPYAQWAWMQMGGTIPAGFLVHHLDGDELNDAGSNLALVTRGTHILIHHDELKDARSKGHVSYINVVCSRCSAIFRGKYQRRDSRCEECKKMTKREWARAR